MAYDVTVISIQIEKKKPRKYPIFKDVLFYCNDE